MDFLRNEAPLTEEMWASIDNVVTGTAKEALTGRRLIPLCGPLGGGVSFAPIDSAGKEEVMEDGVSLMTGRKLAQIPQLYEDFWLYWRDLEYARQHGVPVELSQASQAAQRLSNREDSMIFYGIPQLGTTGLLNTEGIGCIKQNDWSKSENAFSDVAKAAASLKQAGKLGTYKLLVSLDLYVQLQRIVPGTGVLESERIAKLTDGLCFSTILEPKTAAVIVSSSQYMDLLVGQDIRTAYTETVDFNHHLRVMETALFRLKDPGAVVLIK